MNHILDYFFFILIFVCLCNITLQLWKKYVRINKTTIDGSKLVDTYLDVEAMKSRKVKF